MSEQQSFEDAIKALEESVALLEGGELSLEESLKIFKTAVRHIDDCRKALDKAELEVARLQKQEDGSFSTEPFDD